jgi:hypothetical protein
MSDVENNEIINEHDISLTYEVNEIKTSQINNEDIDFID